MIHRTPKKPKKAAKKKQKLVNISHNICSKHQINTDINNDYFDIEEEMNFMNRTVSLEKASELPNKQESVFDYVASSNDA